MGETEPELSKTLAEVYSAICVAERLVGLGSADRLFEAATLLAKAAAACCQIRNKALQMSQPARRQAASELARIRTSLGRVGILLNSAAEFHAGWSRLVETRCLAYGPNGNELGLPADSGRGRRCDASG